MKLRRSWNHAVLSDRIANTRIIELYTDESPGLKVDPVVVLVLSVGFIISVVALHGTFAPFNSGHNATAIGTVTDNMSFTSHCEDHQEVLVIEDWFSRGAWSIVRQNFRCLQHLYCIVPVILASAPMGCLCRWVKSYHIKYQ